MSGFCGAGVFIFIPLFVAEIAEDSVRGSLGSLLVLSCNIGILIAFIAGNYLTYNISPIIHASLPILFFMAFVFFPESPQYLMKIGKEEVNQSIMFENNVTALLEFIGHSVCVYIAILSNRKLKNRYVFTETYDPRHQKKRNLLSQSWINYERVIKF